MNHKKELLRGLWESPRRLRTKISEYEASLNEDPVDGMLPARS